MRETTAILMFPTTIFQYSVHPQRVRFPLQRKEKKVRNLHRLYKRNVALRRWNARRALRARRFSRENARARICAEAALPKRRPVEIIHNNESHA